MDNERTPLYSNYYMTLFSDGTIGLSDGAGYLDTLEKDEVERLFLAIKQYKERQND